MRFGITSLKTENHLEVFFVGPFLNLNDFVANARWEYMASAQARAGRILHSRKTGFSSTLVATDFVTNADGTTCYGARGRGFESRQFRILRNEGCSSEVEHDRFITTCRHSFNAAAGSARPRFRR